MPATGRDIAVFVSGLAVAGAAPILAFPALEFGPMFAQLSGVVGGMPLQHVGIVALVALVAAAWIDTGLGGDPAADREHWE
ncbi:hypothetical protein [Halorientalis halophila]|uniref:hypothetical protein n=1 Tax=Halorientalis halophila TaxID=3108499 RepID=UPI00300AC117